MGVTCFLFILISDNLVNFIAQAVLRINFVKKVAFSNWVFFVRSRRRKLWRTCKCLRRIALSSFFYCSHQWMFRFTNQSTSWLQKCFRWKLYFFITYTLVWGFDRLQIVEDTSRVCWWEAFYRLRGLLTRRENEVWVQPWFFRKSLCKSSLSKTFRRKLLCVQSLLTIFVMFLVAYIDIVRIRKIQCAFERMIWESNSGPHILRPSICESTLLLLYSPLNS